jgi:hypothetical protein
MSAVRVFPAGGGASSFTFEGHTYSAEPGGYVDIAEPRAVADGVNRGWVRGPEVGTTAERPTNAARSEGRGRLFIDTSVGSVLVFDGGHWRSLLTGAEA